MEKFALQEIINRISLLKIRHLGSFTSDFVPTLDNDTFAIINTQPSNMQVEHWIMIANCRHELYFADSLGCKGYSFLKQHYKQMLPTPLQSHTLQSTCTFSQPLYVNVQFILCFCPFFLHSNYLFQTITIFLHSHMS